MLLDRAYYELSKNTGFAKALLATGNSTLTHSLGKKDPHRTILTEKEFCDRLYKVREYLKEKWLCLN